jgi:hypothetical protein
LSLGRPQLRSAGFYFAEGFKASDRLCRFEAFSLRFARTHRTRSIPISCSGVFVPEAVPASSHMLFEAHARAPFQLSGVTLKNAVSPGQNRLRLTSRALTRMLTANSASTAKARFRRPLQHSPRVIPQARRIRRYEPFSCD